MCAFVSRALPALGQCSKPFVLPCQRLSSQHQMLQLSSGAYHTNFKYGQHRDLRLVTTFCTVYGHVMTMVIMVLRKQLCM